MAVRSRLELPARKVFVRDLKQVFPVSPSSIVSSTAIKLWTFPCFNKWNPVSIVWLQGRVMELRENEFVLNDTTGSAHIITPDVPAGCPKPSIGQYLMVVGQLESTGERPIVRATKLHDLSADIILQTLWPLEVEDARQQCET